MAALILFQIRLDGHPAGRPEVAVFVDIIIFSAGVRGNVVVAIASQTEHARILIEGIAAGGIGHQGEKVLFAQIVDPGVRRVGAGDDVFAGSVIKIAVLHGVSTSCVNRNGETVVFLPSIIPFHIMKIKTYSVQNAQYGRGECIRIPVET